MTERTPYCHKIRYGITGAPILDGDDMDGTHAPGVGLAPKVIELVYSAARDGKAASVAASVTGDWTRFGQRDPDGFGGQVTTHFGGDPSGWPEWLAAEVRMHDPAAASAVPVAAPPTEQAALRDRIELAIHSELTEYRLGRDTGMIVQRLTDAALRVLPPGSDRGSVLLEAADALDADMERFFSEWPDEPRNSPYALGRKDAADELRRLAAETPQPETQAAPAEDPARIDRLRPEFTEHASIESIDAQLRRARSQQRRWHLRVEWLISLREARVAQKERGEWPAVVQADGEA